MSKREWTAAQRQAIEARGGDLLVSAAAGSGKTAVLTERVISLITDPEQPVDIDRLLIVTFSNAAAAEMRERIAARLQELMEQEPESSMLRRQSLLLGNADICTIHAFCLRLIRENFQLLGLPADLRLAGEGEMVLLCRNVVTELLEEEYEKGDPVFLRLVELLSGSRNDSKVTETLLTLHGFLRNHPFYEDWAKETLAQEKNSPLDDTPWSRILRNYAAEMLEYAERLLRECTSDTEPYEELKQKAGPLLAEDCAMVASLRKALAESPWDLCVDQIALAEFPRFPTVKDPQCTDAKDRILRRRRRSAAVISDMKTKVFLMKEASFYQDRQELEPLMQKLVDLVLQFDKKLSEEKRLCAKLDFNDLEHYALTLLFDREKNAPTVLADSLSARYAGILMDEYQDTNEIQEKIFSAIAAGGVPRFMVGDVKQSIYRFRQACPEIFLQKKESFAPYDNKHFPSKISLSANFRTRREITEWVNELFFGIMNPVVGEMNYQPEDALESRLDFDYTVPRPVSVMALTSPQGWSREDTTAGEARRIAREIGELLKSGFTVEENGTRRPARAGDICILLRSAKGRAEEYRKALEDLRIPARIGQKDGLLSAREIACVVSYLRVLSNPMQDLELAKVLCSPMYGCTGDDIAEARVLNRRGSLFLTIGCGELAENPRFAAFREDFGVLRSRMQSIPAAQLIREICERTYFEEKCRVLPDGERCIANLRLLREYAAEYEKGSGADSNFGEYLSRLEENKCDLPAAVAGAGDTVSIMTVHRAKGLEFPVVFLAGCTEQFQRVTQGAGADIALNRELGFACKLRDNRTMQQHKTLPLAAIHIENQRAALSEEMRILYVALTRAREKLYIVASGAKVMEKCGSGLLKNDGKMPVYLVRDAKCWWDWIAPTLDASRTEYELICDVLEAEEPKIEEKPATAKTAAKDSELAETMWRNLTFCYPHEEDTATPRRISVSDLAKRESHEEYLLSRRPKCLTQSSLTAAEQGTAAHKVMQFADYRALAQDPQAEMQRLVREGYLFREEGEHLQPDMVLKLLDSPLGKRLLSADCILREIRFLQEFTPEELSAIDPSLQIHSKTLLMGAVDCVVIEGDRVTVVDYKTDRVKAAEELVRRYAAQIRLYRAIVERQLGLPVTETLIYSFPLASVIPVE